MGAGFQFVGEVIKKNLKDETTSVLLFHLGCFALDYIRKTSPYRDPRTDDLMEPEISPLVMDFSAYILNPESREGDTFIAGCRNLDQSALTILDLNKDIFCGMVLKVEISRYGGSIKDRVTKNFAMMQSSM